MAYITGTVDEELLLRREYLSAENRILIQQLQGCLRLSDPQRQTLAAIGHRLGRKALADVACAHHALRWPAAACAGLATVAVKGAVLIWDLARMDILTIRLLYK